MKPNEIHRYIPGPFTLTYVYVNSSINNYINILSDHEQGESILSLLYR